MEKSSAAEDANFLIGNWKLVSSQVIVDGEVHDLFGSNPNGYLILTPQGRLCAITTTDIASPERETLKGRHYTDQCLRTLANTASKVMISLLW